MGFTQLQLERLYLNYTHALEEELRIDIGNLGRRVYLISPRADPPAHFLHQQAMDRDPGMNVWNEPIRSYEVQSFQKIPSHDLTSYQKKAFALSPLAQFSAGPHREYYDIHFSIFYGREEKVGEMKMEALLQTDATGAFTDGEWLVSQHPDFLWNFKKKIQPRAAGLTVSFSHKRKQYYEFLEKFLEIHVVP